MGPFLKSMDRDVRAQIQHSDNVCHVPISTSEHKELTVKAHRVDGPIEDFLECSLKEINLQPDPYNYYP